MMKNIHKDNISSDIPKCVVATIRLKDIGSVTRKCRMELSFVL